MKRQPAWRIFAAEYNDTTLETKAEEEKSPSFVISPLGSKINRVFITGVLTDVENVSEDGEFLRAHISDPTGVFTLYSGQFQQEATTTLQNIEVPAFVSIVGKVRTYEPEEGTLFVSVRPELVNEVTSEHRDRWIVDVCNHTKLRIEAMKEAQKLSPPKAYDLQQLGYPRNLAEGICAALNHYDSIDVKKYGSLIRESLQFIIPEGNKKLDIPPEPEVKEKPKQKPSKQTPKKPSEEQQESEDADQEVEDLVFETIKKVEGEEGALWDTIVDHCKEKGLDEDAVEEAITSLMEKGFIYEPVLGTIKTT